MSINQNSLYILSQTLTELLNVGMLTRLARPETRKNFSVSSIEFLAVEKCSKQLDRRSFNDCRYAKPPAGSLRVSWESVTPVGSMDGR